MGAKESEGSIGMSKGNLPQMNGRPDEEIPMQYAEFEAIWEK
jgi:hypothetical protein